MSRPKPVSSLALVAAALLGALASCSEPPAPPRPAPSGASRPADPPAAASTSAATSATASSPQAASPAPPFHVVANLESAASLHPLAGGALVLSAAGVLVIDGDDLTFDPKWQAGLEALRASPPSGSLVQAGGRFPEGAFVATIEDAAVPGGTTSIVYEWSGGRWTKRSKGEDNLAIVGLAPWEGGQTLAVFAGQTRSDMRFEAFGAAPTPMPQPDLDTGNALCRALLSPDAFTALPSGEVFVAGTACKPAEEGYMPMGKVVERWAPGAARGVVDPLPAPAPLRLTAIVALARNDVYVAGGAPDGPARRGPEAPAYLAHFDGARWQPSPLPAEARGELTTIAGGADGKLWAAIGDALWRREPDGTWALVPLPPSGEKLATAVSLWVRGPGDVWALRSGPRSATLLHTRPLTRAFVPPAKR